MFILLAFVIKLNVIMVIYELKLPTKMFSSNNQAVRHTCIVASNIISSFNCSCKGQEQLKLLKYSVM